MSKISAIRFINLNYNDDMTSVSDKTFFCNGINTLMALENGGGKSVLIQMITALFVQKRFRDAKNRPFGGFFNSHKPTFIMVEWEREQKAGYVLTGMMVRKSQKNQNAKENDLEMINFISEYKEQCERDIHHLPVVTKTDKELVLKSFADCRTIFDNFRRGPYKQSFFMYDMNKDGQAADYFEKLHDYGIEYKEWQNIIKKINRDEGALALLFQECKDEQGVVTTWFLDAVEKKLNTNTDKVAGFRDILEDYINTCFNNRVELRNKYVFERFEEEAARIKEQADKNLKAVIDQDARRANIVSYLITLKNMKDITEKALNTEVEQIIKLKQELKKTDHQKHSAKFYELADKIAALKEESDRLDAELKELGEEKNAWERKLHLLEVAERQEIVDRENEQYEKANQALQIFQRNDEDLKPERDYIGYLLCEYYKDEHSRIEALHDETVQEIKTKKDTEANMRNDIDDITQKQIAIEGELSRLSTLIDSYSKEEARYNKRWNEHLDRNMYGEYDFGGFDHYLEELNKKITEARSALATKRQLLGEIDDSIEFLKKTLEKQRQQKEQVAVNLTSAKVQKEELDQEIEYRNTALKYFDLTPEDIYNTVKILHTADRKIDDLETGIDCLKRESEKLKEEINVLSTGKTIELTPELQRIFERHGINIVQGLEWLKHDGASEQKKLSLVDRNPYLPHALLMTNNEWERLKNDKSDILSSVLIPIVLRETLADSDVVETEETESFQKVHFFTSFNRDLLNEERLKELISQKSKELNGKENDIEEKKEEADKLKVLRSKIKDQKLSKTAYDSLISKIDALNAQETELQRNLELTDAKIKNTAKKREQVDHELTTEDQNVQKMEDQHTDLEELSQAYKSYQQRIQENTNCEKKKEALGTQKTAIQGQLKSLEDDLEILACKKREFDEQKAETAKLRNAYAQYKETKRPENFASELANNIQQLIARYKAITGDRNAKEEELKAESASAYKRLTEATNNLKRLAKKYELNPEDWEKTQFSHAEQDRAEAEIEKLKDAQNEKDDAKAEKIISITKIEYAQETCLEWMQRDCETKTPLPLKDVPKINFKEQKDKLLLQKQEHEKNQDQATALLQIYGGNISALIEFKDDPTEGLTCLSDDFSTFSCQDFEEYTHNKLEGYKAAVKNVTAQREELEKTIEEIKGIQEFNDDYYKTLFATLVKLEHDPREVIRQIEVVLASHQEQMELLNVNIATINKEKTEVLRSLLEYTDSMHKEMAKIDNNSSVPIRDKSLKMLKLSLPKWEDNDQIYKRRLEDFVDKLTNEGIERLEQDKSIHDLVGKELTSAKLYDAVIGIMNIHILIYKIESQRERLLSWDAAATNSNGEGFLSAFIILSCLLYYMRRDDNDIFADKNEGKVLIMDNPFGKTNAPHLLLPMMELALKNNTQLICLTGHDGESIYNCFNNIYVLNKIPVSLNGVEYIEGKHIEGAEPEILDSARFRVSDPESEQIDLF